MPTTTTTGDGEDDDDDDNDDGDDNDDNYQTLGFPTYRLRSERGRSYYL